MSDFPLFWRELRISWKQILGSRVNLVAMKRVNSTQLWARRLLERHLQEAEVPLPFAVVAYEQTEGHGRDQRPWWSASGRGVWATLVWPIESLEEANSLPLRTAVGLCQTVREVIGIDCRLKWPNDLLVGREKLAGVLVDLIVRGRQQYGLIGFGLNVEHLPGELPVGIATSIRCVCGLEVITSERFAPFLVAGVTAELNPKKDWHSRYLEWLIHQPGDLLRCRVGQEQCEGIFGGIDTAGFLWLETPSGRRVVHSGDVFGW